MKSNKTILFLLLGALLSGGLAVYFTQNYIDRQQRTYKLELDRQYESEKVVVAIRDLPSGTIIDGNTVAMRDMPATFVHRAAIRPNGFENIRGKKLIVPLGKGEPILPDHLSSAKDASFSSLIEEGNRGVTVEVDRISSFSGLLTPGDNIDLLVTLRDESDEEITFSMLNNIKILATGNKTGLETGENGMSASYQTITLSLTPEQSAKIIHARRIGTITAVLRSPGDNQFDLEETITKNTLLGKLDKKNEPSRGIEIILGGK